MMKRLVPFCNRTRTHYLRAFVMAESSLVVSLSPRCRLLHTRTKCCSLSMLLSQNTSQIVCQHLKQQTSGFSRNFASSPFDPSKNTTRSPSSATTITKPSNSAAQKRLDKFIPRKAVVQLTEKARLFFKQLLENPPRPEIVGIMLHYDQSKTGQPRMVFSFSFVTADDLASNSNRNAEGVSLEVVLDKNGVETPKSPADAWEDGLPKLFVHPNAFLKVLGATLDVDLETVAPILLDRQGNRMDPNA